MEWFESILSHVVTLIGGIGGSILYFRPKLKEAQAGADIKTQEAKNFQYESLINRINSMEKMYNEQIASQNDIIANLRAEVLKLSEEKFTNEKRMLQFEQENETLRKRVTELEAEVKRQR